MIAKINPDAVTAYEQEVERAEAIYDDELSLISSDVLSYANLENFSKAETSYLNQPEFQKESS